MVVVMIGSLLLLLQRVHTRISATILHFGLADISADLAAAIRPDGRQAQRPACLNLMGAPTTARLQWRLQLEREYTFL